MTDTHRLKTALVGVALFSCLAGLCRSAEGKGDGDGTKTDAEGDDRAGQKVVDLLSRVKLAREKGDDGCVVSGSWDMLMEGLKCVGPVSEAAPGRIRFGAAYAGDYDLCMTFTPIQGRGGVGIVLAHKGRELAWMMGTGDGSTFDFQPSSRPGNTASDISPLINGLRRRVEIRVRGNRVCATIDGRPESECLADFSNLGLRKNLSLGRGQLGVVSAREILVHSAEMKCLMPAKPGRPKTHVKAGEQGRSAPNPAGAGQVLPAKRVFRGEEIKTFTPDRIRRMGCTLVVVKRTADRVILRQDGERRYCAEWIFAVKGNRLSLINYRPLNGTHRAMDQVQAGGVINGKYSSDQPRLPICERGGHAASVRAGGEHAAWWTTRRKEREVLAADGARAGPERSNHPCLVPRT